MLHIIKLVCVVVIRGSAQLCADAADEAPAVPVTERVLAIALLRATAPPSLPGGFQPCAPAALEPAEVLARLDVPNATMLRISSVLLSFRCCLPDFPPRKGVFTVQNVCIGHRASQPVCAALLSMLLAFPTTFTFAP